MKAETTRSSWGRSTTASRWLLARSARLSTQGSRLTLPEAELGATVPHDVMGGLEIVIVQLRRELEERDHRHDERLQEMHSELDTLTGQLSSSRPKRMTVASALWAVGGWAVEIYWLTAAPGRIGTVAVTPIYQSFGTKEEKWT